MVNLSKAVHQTRNYAAYFHSRLDDESLHHWLISEEIVLKNLLSRFPQKLSKRQLLDIQTYQAVSALKTEKARRIAHFLSYFPTITLVAVTGSLAVDNARVDDDLDLFIITRADTLWLTRLIVIPLIGIFFKRRLPKYQISNIKSQIADSVCLNLWLDETALALPENKRNLYTAHEVLQAKPLFDRGGTYAKFILANSWTKKYLANAYAGTVIPASSSSSRTRGSINIDSHFRGNDNTIWSGMTILIKAINHIAFHLQFRYMKSKITRETITLHSAYFHPRIQPALEF